MVRTAVGSMRAMRGLSTRPVSVPATGLASPRPAAASWRPGPQQDDAVTSPAKRHSSGMFVGDALTLQQQVANLRILGDGNLVRNMRIGSALIALAGLAWFWFSDHDTEKVLALFFGGCGALVCLAISWGGPGFRHAAAATHKGRREPATIVLHPGLDDDAREGTMQGVLHPQSAHAHAWRMDFAKTFGWHPPEGLLQVEAVYLSDIAWPVLLVHPDGLLVPRGKPRRVD